MKKLRILLLLPLLFWIAIQVLNFLSAPAATLGVADGKLAKCAAKPNSVCSQHADEQHSIEPLAYSTSAETAWTSLRAVVDCMPAATVVEVTDDYMRCEFRTLLMRYIDDVEFLNVTNDQVIHVRSASRIGYSDMGANRNRIERVRSALASQIDDDDSGAAK